MRTIYSGVDAMSEIGEGPKIFLNFSSHQSSNQGGRGKKDIFISLLRYKLIRCVDSFSVCIAAWQPPCVQLLLPTLSRLGFMESLAEMLEILRY